MENDKSVSFCICEAVSVCDVSVPGGLGGHVKIFKINTVR